MAGGKTVSVSTAEAAPAAEDKAVGFVPAVSFLGFPDGATGRWYHAGKRESAPAEYVDLLRAKGLAIELAAAPTAEAPVDGNLESEGK